MGTAFLTAVLTLQLLTLGHVCVIEIGESAWRSLCLCFAVAVLLWYSLAALVFRARGRSVRVHVRWFALV